MSTTSLSELCHKLRIASDVAAMQKPMRTHVVEFLSQELKAREQKRITHLLRTSGIKRVKLLGEFDWTFNPKIRKDKIMEYMHTEWLKSPSNLVLIGPAGVGKTHIATALCHDALMKGHQSLFVNLFDFTAKLARARSL